MVNLKLSISRIEKIKGFNTDYCEKKARRLEKYHNSIGRKETDMKQEKECHYYT